MLPSCDTCQPLVAPSHAPCPHPPLLPLKVLVLLTPTKTHKIVTATALLRGCRGGGGCRPCNPDWQHAAGYLPLSITTIPPSPTRITIACGFVFDICHTRRHLCNKTAQTDILQTPLPLHCTPLCLALRIISTFYATSVTHAAYAWWVFAASKAFQCAHG